MSADDTIVLEIPADAAHLVTARVFAAALGRQTGVAEDRIIGLQLAVSDIASWLLAAASPEDSIAIRATLTERRIGMEVQPIGFPMPAEHTAHTDEIAEPPGDTVWGLDLVRVLIEDMTVNSGVPAVTFWLPREH